MVTSLSFSVGLLWAALAAAPPLSAELSFPPLGRGPAAFSQSRSAAAFGAGHFLAVWEDAREGVPVIYAARVAPGGTLLDSHGVRIAPGRAPDVTFNGASFLVVWEAGHRIEAALVNAAGTPGAVISVSSSGTAQRGFPSVAASGAEFLVAWEDCRNAIPPCAVGSASGNLDLFGARLSATGAVLDAAGLLLISQPGFQAEPAVAGGTGGWGVAWRDGRTGVSDIRATRVSTSGTVSADVLVSGAANEQLVPAIAWDGTQYVIAWQDRRTDFGDIYGARMTAAGAVLDPTGVLLHNATALQYAPDLGCGPSSCLVTWHDHRAPALLLNGTRIDTALTVLDAVGIPLSGGGVDPDQSAVAFGGGEFVIFWEDDPDGAGLDVYASRASPAGVRLGTPLLVSAAEAEQQEAVAAPGFLVAWRESTELRAARIGPGAVTSAASSLASASQAPAASRALVAFSSAKDIYATWLDGGFPVCNAVGEQGAPAVDCLDGICLVAWADRRAGSRDVFAAFVSPDAGVWPSDGFAIASGTPDQSAPAVSAHDGGFVVAWVEQRIATYGDVLGSRVELDGGLAPLTFTAGPLDEAAPALAGSVAAWRVWLEDGGSQARFAGGSFASDSAPALTFDGESYVLAFAYRGQVLAARFAPDGGQLDSAPFLVGDGFEASVAADSAGTTVFAYPRFDGAAKNVQLYARLALTGDAGWPDAGGPDAGGPDAGTDDAGAPDAGPPDAGLPDAGLTDAGQGDAGAVDAGGTVVKRPRLGEELGPAVGCGCGATGPSSAGWWAAALLLLLVKRARRSGQLAGRPRPAR